MQINVVYDPDVSGAPAGFKTAVDQAVAYLDKLISNDITLTVEFGWGQAGPLNGNVSHAAAESLPAWSSVGGSTNALQAALAAAYSANGLSNYLGPNTLPSVIATLPGTSDLSISYAQALALNLGGTLQAPPSTVSYVALNANDTWNWDVNKPAAPTAIDAVAAILHEITHDFGRTAGGDGNGSPTETLLDLFRYSAVGVSQATQAGGGYFSLDGNTLLKQFASAETDPADWVISQPSDANGPAITGSSDYMFTALDKLELEALGFSLSTPVSFPILSIKGSAGSQAAPGSATPFHAITITDQNPNSIDTVTIQAHHAGLLAGYSNGGSGAGTSGDTYYISGTAAQVTKAIDTLTFSAGTVAQSPVTVNFTITVTDSAGQQTADSSTSLTLFTPAMKPTMIGTSGADQLSGHNDIFWGGPGNDAVIATGTLNQGLYDGPASQYVMTQNNGVLTVADQVAGRDGLDTLTNVQRLVFQDQIIAFDLTGHAGEAYRMYQAAFDRTPDTAGVSFWTHQLDAGLSLADLAKEFVKSSEFTSIYGAHPNTQVVVSTLYQNVLGRTADAGGLTYWNAQLQGGTTTASLLMSFSESAENNALVLPAIKNGISMDPSLFI